MAGGIQGGTIMKIEDMFFYDPITPRVFASYEENMKRLEEADLSPEERADYLWELEKIEEAKRKTA